MLRLHIGKGYYHFLRILVICFHELKSMSCQVLIDISCIGNQKFRRICKFIKKALLDDFNAMDTKLSLKYSFLYAPVTSSQLHLFHPHGSERKKNRIIKFSQEKSKKEWLIFLWSRNEEIDIKIILDNFPSFSIVVRLKCQFKVTFTDNFEF